MNTNSNTMEEINFVIGIDLGDKVSMICVLSGPEEGMNEYTIETNSDSFLEFFDQFETPSSVVVAMETGTHSPWLSVMLLARGFDVLVGNARKLRAIWDSPE